MMLNVDVAVRVRPFLAEEQEDNKKIKWKIRNTKVTRVRDPNLKRKHFIGDEFLFDNIFNVEQKNLDVFEKVVKRIVKSTIYGVNGTVIAYGQSGSGKTYTMYGTPEDPGIIPLAINYLFDKATEICTREFSFKLSYFEIKNEKINDLMDVDNTDLKLKKSINNLVQVVGCKEETVTDARGVLDILEKCEQNRSIHECALPRKSDKSHRVVRISIENKDKENSSYSLYKFSQLNLIDLAGHKTNDNHHSKEDDCNTMSLTLLNLINVQLNKSSDVEKNINYRSSKLTECLFTSLGGNSITAFICTLSLAALEETQKTLWFASRAKNIVNKPKINTVFHYKYKLEVKICKFHKSLKLRIKMLLHQLMRMQKETELPNQQNKNYCCLSNVIKKINDDSSKLATKPMPVIDENDIFSALGEFKQDLEKLHQKVASLVGLVNSDGNILKLLLSIENDLDKIEPKAILLETFVNILMTVI